MKLRHTSYHDVSAARFVAGEDIRHLGPGFFPGTVTTVSVGTLEDNQIRLAHHLGVVQDWRADVAEVAAEDQLSLFPRSSSHSSTMDEPSMCPASRKRRRTPGRISYS